MGRRKRRKRRGRKKNRHFYNLMARSWDVKFHPKQPENPLVGDIWPVDRYLLSEWVKDNFLSDEYFEQWAHLRPPLQVFLPGNITFCLDSRAGCDGKGWKIEGFPPNISVFPSINILGGFHGFIRNGKVLG